MQPVEQQPAYVLHERPYRETSLLIEALTRDHGRVGLVARGLRKEKPRYARGTLAPMQPVLLSWAGRGELVTLTGADGAGLGVVLAGEALMSALYLNELLVRLLARNDPHPELFDRYASCLAELAERGVDGGVEVAEPVAWTLRRFERDLLAALGYALLLELDAHGNAVDPAADYSYDPERGPVPWGERAIAPSVNGAALLALVGDDVPPESQLRPLRVLMRHVLRHHLGGRDLNAWRLFNFSPSRGAGG